MNDLFGQFGDETSLEKRTPFAWGNGIIHFHHGYKLEVTKPILLKL